MGSSLTFRIRYVNFQGLFSGQFHSIVLWRRGILSQTVLNRDTESESYFIPSNAVESYQHDSKSRLLLERRAPYSEFARRSWGFWPKVLVMPVDAERGLSRDSERFVIFCLILPTWISPFAQKYFSLSPVLPMSVAVERQHDKPR